MTAANKAATPGGFAAGEGQQRWPTGEEELELER